MHNLYDFMVGVHKPEEQIDILSMGAAHRFHPLVLGKKVNIEGYGYILVCKCV